MFGLSIGMVGLSVAVSGCALDQVVKVNVPKDVQVATKSEEKVALADSELLWNDWANYVEKNTEALRSRINAANEQYTVIASLTSLGLETAGTAASTLPGGAFIIAGLTGLGGLFLKRPGTDKLIAKEKEASYNKGLEVGAMKNNE